MELNKSKYLSLLLRHKPELANIELDKEGWAVVSTICTNINITIEELESIVEENDKKRFVFNEDKTKIRASQGHSINNISIKFDSVSPPQVLYHGTKEEFYNSIKKDGLIKGKRHHVHLSSDKEIAKEVGDRRKGKTILLEINSMWMKADNLKFYKSENNVFLTDIVPFKYIKVL